MTVCDRLQSLRLRLARSDQRGAVLVITAICMAMLLAATALAFDIGREVDTNRSVQAKADAIALDAANFLDGSSAAAPDPGSALTSSTIPDLDQVVQYEASESAARNGLVATNTGSAFVTLESCSDAECTSPVPVRTCPYSSVSPATASVSNCTWVNGATSVVDTDVINAVKVTAGGVTNFVFQAGSANSIRTATAVKGFTPPGTPGCTGTGCAGTTTTTTPTTTPTTTSPCTGSGCSTTTTTTPTTPTTTPGTTPNPLGPLSGFTIGSSLASFDSSSSTLLAPVLNGLLGQAFGGTFTGTLVGYQGLATSQVSVGDILSANPSVGTLSSLLNTKVTAKTLLGWVGKALQLDATEAASGDAETSSDLQAAAQTLATLQGEASSSTTLELCQLVDVGGTTACNQSSTAALSEAASAELTLLPLLTAAAGVENGGHFASGNIAGLGVLTVTTSAVSPAASTGLGLAVTSASQCPTGVPYECPLTQADQQVNATITLTTPSVLTTSLSLGLTVNGATSTGTLNTLVCAASGSSSQYTTAGIGVSSTAVGASLSNVSLNTLGTSTNLASVASVGGGAAAGTSNLAFAGPFDEDNPAPQTTGTNNPSINVSIGGSALAGGLSALATDVVGLNGVLTPVLSALGVDVGGATVSDNYVGCGQTPYLVG